MKRIWNKGASRVLDEALIDRLALNPARLDAVEEGLAQVAALADPIGAVSGLKTMPSGIEVGTMRVPLGRHWHHL